jgi:hypothetical protein
MKAPLFKQSTRSQAWNICIEFLKRSPSLQPVKTWFIQEGDIKKARDVTQQDCPALVIRPRVGPAKWIDEISHTSSLDFVHELYVDGIKATDIMDFWGAIEGAWFDGTNNLTQLLEANNNALRVFQRTAIQGMGEPEKLAGGLFQRGTGLVTLFMDITTGE